MKIPVFLLVFLATLKLYAQPGYLPHMKEKDFVRITAALQKDPGNYALIWQRLNIAANPSIDLYTKGAVGKDIFLKQNQPYTFQLWAYRDQVADLNKLIAGNAVVTEYGRTDDRVDFIFLRGKIHYLAGDYKKSLADYVHALDLINKESPDAEKDYKKSTICLAIAAYYYNLQDTWESDEDKYYTSGAMTRNVKEALHYIDMVSPVEFSEPADENLPGRNEPVKDIYEREKINLLTYLEEGERLEHYYKKLMQAQYEQFKQAKANEANSEPEKIKKEGYGYTVDQSYRNTLSYAHELALLYYKREDYKKAKWLSEQVIAHYPANNLGYILDRYDAGIHYLLLNKIYRTKGLEDPDKEMNSLMELLGGATHGINYNTVEVGTYIQERLKERADEPRLYLALAIWHYKNNIEAQNTTTADEILALLNKAEQLNLQDYRLPYTQALVYLHLVKNYDLALEAINKAFRLYTGNPFVYRLKYEILRKFPQPDEKALQELSADIIKLQLKHYPNLEGLLKVINDECLPVIK